eukprot:179952_1
MSQPLVSKAKSADHRRSLRMQENQSQPHLRRIASTRYVIRHRKPRSAKGKSHGNLGEPLLAGAPSSAKPLCDFREDLHQTRRLITGSWINLLLVFVPFGIIAHFEEWSAGLTFFLNFLGMIPLASILGDATECLAEHLGETIGGLLNATFGNAVEVVVMILALLKAKELEHSNPTQSGVLLDVVQTSLIGSIFSNSLLVLGCAFVANGWINKESSFNTTTTSANVALLMISAFVMLLPGAYTDNQDKKDVMMVSRAAAMILMLMYCCLLVFVLWTHKDIMDDDETGPMDVRLQSSRSVKSIKEDTAEVVTDDDYDSPHRPLSSLQIIGDQAEDDTSNEEGEEEDVELTLIGSLVVLCVATLAVAWLSEYLVDAINPMAEQLNMKPAFVGIILLPIIGNAVEHITAIRMAYRDKMDIALSIAIGSATQVAMFVVSLAVIVGWIIDLDLSLAFDPFEINLFIYSSIIIFATISDGSSNWLEGVMLLGLYLLIAIAVYHQNYCSGITKIEHGGTCP